MKINVYSVILCSQKGKSDTESEELLSDFEDITQSFAIDPLVNKVFQCCTNRTFNPVFYFDLNFILTAT